MFTESKVYKSKIKSCYNSQKNFLNLVNPINNYDLSDFCPRNVDTFYVRLSLYVDSFCVRLIYIIYM